MKARARLKEQELFYAQLDGKHVAHITHNDHVYMNLRHRHSYDSAVCVNFIEGYRNETSETNRNY